MRIENSFIGVRGVGETTERRLWTNGVTHWEEFDGSIVGRTLAARIESYIEEGWDRLDRGDLGYFADGLPTSSRWRLYENAVDEACFLDIETTGLDAPRHEVTTVSVHQDGHTRTFVNGRDLTAERLDEELSGAGLLVTFNGRRFDVPFLETCFDLEVDVPHLDLMYPCQRLDLRGGLKRIERDVGIERDRPDISGRDAVRLWHEYERGDERALETLVSYNRADTVNLQTLAEEVVERLDRQMFDPVHSTDR